jgi:hypothetical protein
MIVHGDVEGDLHRVWNLISELSEQLEKNRADTAELHLQADALKVRTAFVDVSLLNHVAFRLQLCIRVPDIL